MEGLILKVEITKYDVGTSKRKKNEQHPRLKKDEKMKNYMWGLKSKLEKSIRWWASKYFISYYPWINLAGNIPTKSKSK